ncbi:Midasin, partial [Coniochaeta hoffmannii]
MAAAPFDPALPSNSFLFDIYADGQAAPIKPKLPSGPCNFADTTPGANGNKCGCRRFWSRQGAARGAFADTANSDQAGWCMCSHHACYHDDFAPGQAPISAVDVFPEQENARPRTNREPLSPMQDIASFQMPTNVPGSMDLDLLNIPGSFAFTNQNVAEPPGVISHSHGQDSSLPDTLNWGTFLASQPGQDGSFPPIPPQCLMPTGPPSTASSSQVRYLRPFAGKGLQTLSGGSAAKSREPLLDRITEASVSPEAAAPSGSDTVHASQVAEDARSSATMTGISRDAFLHISKTVQGHEHRLDRLENTSFSVAGHEECQEKHDHTDLRVTELESRVEEVEKILNNDGSSSIGSARRRLGLEVSDSATASVASVSTTAAGASQMYSQLQALQAQVNHLQSASAPSYNNPWELEVVFLPFPLKGIWIEARDIQAATQAGATARTSGEWTQMPNTGSRAAPEPLSTSVGPAYGDFHGPDWLLPRACAPGGMVDKRLRSRGLVKTVAVRGPDARSVQVAINTAFADVLRVGASDVASRVLVHRVAQIDKPPPLGLQQAWVPLRKIHKDSRLRFLAPAELVTPSLWDYTFLTSSVVMRASGLQRLYITQREAYLQDHPIGYQAWESCWTWQKLRTLTRVYPDSQSSSNGEVPEADAKETCWTWNDRLDEPPSFSRPAQPNRSWARRSSTSPSQQYFTGIQSPLLSNSPAATRAKSPLTLKDRRATRPEHIRTNSLPPAATATGNASPSLPKRRVSSTINPYDRRPSPLIQRSSPRPAHHTTTTTTSFFKRRSSTRSPSFFIPRTTTTPRWSQARLSRSPSLAPFAQGPFDEHRGERRTTPFCYATPYSNAPASARATSRGPVAPTANPYYADDDEEDEGDEGEDEDMGAGDIGSETDPYDSEATNEFSPSREHHLLRLGGGGDGEEGGMDIDVYEDELSDDLSGSGSGSRGGGWRGQQSSRRSNTATRHLAEQDHAHGQVMVVTAPEDEPWPGIEDMSSDGDGENVDPDGM